MELEGRRIVVTGGASGIGRGLAEAFVAAGAGEVVIADLDRDHVEQVADAIGAIPAVCDVGREKDLRRLIAAASVGGAIDVFCSNAGINGPVGGPETPDEDWDLIWRVNVMAHIWAARALLPAMLERGAGHLVSTASAAGLLTNLGMLPYSVTKHAAVAFAEWMSATYHADGIRVSCLCPQLVETPMATAIRDDPTMSRAMSGAGDWLSPARVAALTLEAIEQERFLVLPHPEVRQHAVRRAQDTDRWLEAMGRMWSESRAG